LGSETTSKGGRSRGIGRRGGKKGRCFAEGEGGKRGRSVLRRRGRSVLRRRVRVLRRRRVRVVVRIVRRVRSGVIALGSANDPNYPYNHKKPDNPN
jgi:hypothetical protein